MDGGEAISCSDVGAGRLPGECSFEQQCQLQQHQLIEGQPLSGPLLPRHAHWAVDLPDCLSSSPITDVSCRSLIDMHLYRS